MKGNLCIIPARGGSKRIPRKNIKDFLGKPIIGYSIQAALESRLFDEVMVSTDDEEIAEIAIKLGAIVPFMRSVSNSNDFAGTYDVIEEVIKTYNQNGKDFKYSCCIYPTAPLISTKRLKEGLNLLKTSKYTTVFPIVEFNYPILRSLKLENLSKVSMNFPEYQSSRSQDLPKSFHDAGQFYWFDIKNLLETKELFGKNSGAIILSQLEVQDIDNISDWHLAELKYQLRHEKGSF